MSAGQPQPSVAIEEVGIKQLECGIGSPGELVTITVINESTLIARRNDVFHYFVALCSAHWQQRARYAAICEDVHGKVDAPNAVK